MIPPYAASISYYTDNLVALAIGKEPDNSLFVDKLNRCSIIASSGPLTLTVPIVGGSKILRRGTEIDQLKVSEHGNWRHVHWGAIFSAYGKAPFFEHYAHLFEPIYMHRWEKLVDLNLAVHNTIVKALKIENYKKYIENDKQLPLPSDAQYWQLRNDKFGFIPDMSILDLLFNLGPESIVWLIGRKQNSTINTE